MDYLHHNKEGVIKRLLARGVPDAEAPKVYYTSRYIPRDENGGPILRYISEFWALYTDRSDIGQLYQWFSTKICTYKRVVHEGVFEEFIPIVFEHREKFVNLDVNAAITELTLDGIPSETLAQPPYDQNTSDTIAHTCSLCYGIAAPYAKTHPLFGKDKELYLDVMSSIRREKAKGSWSQKGMNAILSKIEKLKALMHKRMKIIEVGEFCIANNLVAIASESDRGDTLSHFLQEAKVPTRQAFLDAVKGTKKRYGAIYHVSMEKWAAYSEYVKSSREGFPCHVCRDGSADFSCGNEDCMTPLCISCFGTVFLINHACPFCLRIYVPISKR
jgi:hypothetical protein